MNETKYDAEHCSRWPGIPQNALTDSNRRHVEILTCAFGTGVYNIPCAWKRADYRPGVSFFPLHVREFSTWDFNRLTRLVILAHDHCVRISIGSHGPKMMLVSMFDRQRDGRMNERHPTIEQAIADLRGAK